MNKRAYWIAILTGGGAGAALLIFRNFGVIFGTKNPWQDMVLMMIPAVLAVVIYAVWDRSTWMSAGLAAKLGCMAGVVLSAVYILAIFPVLFGSTRGVPSGDFLYILVFGVGGVLFLLNLLTGFFLGMGFDFYNWLL